jgi:hypothetical protein
MLLVETRLVKTQNYVEPTGYRWQTPTKPPWVDGPPTKLVSFQRDTETGAVKRLPKAVHGVPTLPTPVRGPLDPSTGLETTDEALKAKALAERHEATLAQDEQLILEAEAKLAADKAASLRSVKNG